MRIDAKILAFFALAAALILGLAELASEVMAGGTFAFDRFVLRALRDPLDPSLPIGPTWLNSAMVDITAFGGTTGLTLITVIVTLYLLVRGRRGTAVFLAAAVIGGTSVGRLLKLAFDRPRPEVVTHLVEVHSASFPSGHAMNSAIVYLTLGAMLARTEADRAVRIYILAIAILLSLTIGFSRLYLGVHWPSDVMAGWIVGGVWATGCSLLARALQKRHQIEEPDGET